MGAGVVADRGPAFDPSDRAHEAVESEADDEREDCQQEREVMQDPPERQLRHVQPEIVPEHGLAACRSSAPPTPAPRSGPRRPRHSRQAGRAATRRPPRCASSRSDVIASRISRLATCRATCTDPIARYTNSRWPMNHAAATSTPPAPSVPRAGASRSETKPRPARSRRPTSGLPAARLPTARRREGRRARRARRRAAGRAVTPGYADTPCAASQLMTSPR